MVSGNLMPRPPSVLASLITITFISRFPLPAKWLKGTFRVRRAHVRAALHWLKDNNPYYSEIQIDDNRLADLPEDDVPHELLSVVREERDEINIARENDNYIPEENEPEDTSESTLPSAKYILTTSIQIRLKMTTRPRELYQCSF
jgi:hypothetical protein